MSTAAVPSGRPKRVVSIDALRGLDLFLLFGFGPIFRAFADGPWAERFEASGFWTALTQQLHHVGWEGFVAWDLIMPLFLFLAGAAIPFSLSRYTNRENGRPTAKLFVRIAKRLVLLWIFGMIIQGNLLGLKIQGLRLYSNTLQAIAAGYLIAAVVYLITGRIGQIIAIAGLLFGFWFVMARCVGTDAYGACGGGSYAPGTNFAEFIDRAVLGRWRDGVSFAPDGTWSFSDGYNYTWILSSLTFGATTLFGVLAGEIIRAGRKIRVIPLAGDAGQTPVYPSQPAHRTALLLAVIGAILLVGAIYWARLPEGNPAYCPLIKKLWTPSMTLFAAGLSFLLTSFFYELFDVLKFRIGVVFLTVIGMNSIAAYMMGNLFHQSFCDISRRVLYGTEQYLGAYYPPMIEIAAFALLWLILYAMWRCGRFLRV